MKGYNLFKFTVHVNIELPHGRDLPTDYVEGVIQDGIQRGVREAIKSTLVGAAVGVVILEQVS